jgi:predicted AAA+ superfamily ATPase
MTPTLIDTDNPEFQNALKLIQYTRQSVFLTGKAGTGKSTFLKYVCQHTKKKYVVLAPTGIAAINAGGSTLHSFFKLPFHPLLPDDPKFQGRKLKDFLKYSSDHRKLIQNIELIIIDEISMSVNGTLSEHQKSFLKILMCHYDSMKEHLIEIETHLQEDMLPFALQIEPLNTIYRAGDQGKEHSSIRSCTARYRSTAS